jgi:hypothetical protein
MNDPAVIPLAELRRASSPSVIRLLGDRRTMKPAPSAKRRVN